jgi:hypothetical protein
MVEKIQNQLLAVSMFEPTNTQQICDSIVTNALLCVAQRKAQKMHDAQVLDAKDAMPDTAFELQRKGQLKAEMSQYSYEALVKQLRTIINWNPLNLHNEESLLSTITKSCLLCKPRSRLSDQTKIGGTTWGLLKGKAMV